MADTWAIVELMGHVKMAGRLSEEEKFGGKLGRIDVPRSEKCNCSAAQPAPPLPLPACEKCKGSGFVELFTTQHFGAASVYRITYVTELVARHVATQSQGSPVSVWDFPRQPAITHDPTAVCQGDPDPDDDQDDDELVDENGIPY